MFLNLLNLMLLQVQFDLVTAAYTLSELPHVKDREDAVLTLWRKTKSYLVCLGVCVYVCVFVSVFDVFSLSGSRCWWKMGPKRGIKYLWKPEKLY